MKLTELDPQWVGAGGEGVFKADGSPSPERHGVAISFNCPCGCGIPLCVMFQNPLDGGEPVRDHVLWQRTGDTFDALTLTPSILRGKINGVGCGWHGFITNGEIITV